MLLHQRQARVRNLTDAIEVENKHFDTLISVKSIGDDFDALLQRIESATDDGSVRVREQMAAIHDAMVTLKLSFAELRGIAKHDLHNAEQLVVIHRSKVAA